MKKNDDGRDWEMGLLERRERTIRWIFMVRRVCKRAEGSRLRLSFTLLSLTVLDALAIQKPPLLSIRQLTLRVVV